jgi:putative transposase
MYYNITMGLRLTPIVTGEYYHIYNRGVEKRKIFLDKEDYFHFLKLLYNCNSEKSIILRNISKSFIRGKTIVDIGAYCLMPNHFHLLCYEKIGGGISTFMKKLLTAYAMYFNKKYERTGVLFQGRYKSKHSNTEKYLKYLYAYIHLNPAKLKDPKWKEQTISKKQDLLDFVKKYPYSSFYEYLNNKIKITDPISFPNYFIKSEDYINDLSEWLSIETT